MFINSRKPQIAYFNRARPGPIIMPVLLKIKKERRSARGSAAADKWHAGGHDGQKQNIRV